MGQLRVAACTMVLCLLLAGCMNNGGTGQTEPKQAPENLNVIPQETVIEEDDRLYLGLDGLPAAARLKDGAILWQSTALTAKGNEWPGLLSFGPIAIAGDLLMYGYNNGLLVLDKENGEPLHRIADVRFSYTDGREHLGYDGYLNSDGDHWYIGSASGQFSKLRLFVISK